VWAVKESSLSLRGRTFTYIKGIVQPLNCIMYRCQVGKFIYGLITVIHLQRIAPRLAPDLKALGIEVGYFREGQDRNRLICLEKVVKISSISSIPSIDDAKASQDNSLKADDIADDTRTISNVTDDIADGIANTDDTRTISSSSIVRAENTSEQRFHTVADDMDDMDNKKSLSSSQLNKTTNSIEIPEATDDEF
jgi:hypothetical protein